MPRYAVSPDELSDAAALTAWDGPALEVVRRLVVTAVGQAQAGLGGQAPTLSAAVEGYGHVEGAVLAAVGEAVDILSGGLAAAAHDYTRVDAAGAALFAAPGPGGEQ